MERDLFPEYRKISENIKTNSYLKRELGSIKAAAEKYDGKDIKALKLSDFLIFYKTGSRAEYEYEYFEHRKRLNAYAVLAAAGENKYIEALQDAVWAIADEFTWALPAHIPAKTRIEECSRYIDLFAAETAFTLSELLYMFKDRFEPILSRRIEYEVRRRVIAPYLSGCVNSWDERNNNWAAVCAGSVGAAFLYLADENEIKAALPRLKQTLSCYLSGFGADGACIEGINYWVYGFGYYTYFAELLYRFSESREDLFALDKIKKIAEFPQKLRFRNNRTVSFSDSGSEFVQRCGLSNFLAYKFDSVSVPDDSCYVGYEGDHCARFAHLIRDFAWCGMGGADGAAGVGAYCFESAAWYINKTEKYEFAAKAGNNGESHNHIDIGSFMLNSGGKSIISDPGSGEYTAAYFSSERYSCFAPSADAHSIPIINGVQQSSDESAAGRIVTADSCKLVMELGGAYEAHRMVSFSRSFEFSSDCVELVDKIEFTGGVNSVKEHFVTEAEPQICADGLRIENVLMSFDVENASCSINKHEFKTGKGTKTVYLTDIELDDLKGESEIRFRFCV